uniref:AAA+ ATPase domain-containing protein n=1 Tax=Bionectria ochroleuca TaxID=29856 RepID=A0A8H7TVJ9_BIOOC
MVKKSIDAKVRPLSNTSLEKASLLGAARLYVSKDSLISLTGNLDNGKLCIVERLETEEPLRREAALWVLPEKNLSPNVVMMTRAFQDATGFKIGDQVRISLASDTATPVIEEVVVQEAGDPGQDDGSEAYHPPGWEFSISISLDRAEFIFPGMVLEGVTINKLRRSFKVLSVNSQKENLGKFVLSNSNVRLLAPGDSEDTGAAALATEPAGDLVVSQVPGLARQVKVINAFLKGFGRPFWVKDERESSAFVIHGGHGTGKTFIMQRIADTNWGKVHWIKPSDKLVAIKDTFKQAQTQQPSIVLIDALEELISKDRQNREAVVEAIAEELDALSATAKAQNALPRVVVIASCLDYMTDSHGASGDSQFLRPPIRPKDKESSLSSLAQKTHAYNGDDLANLVLNAKKILGNRLDDAGVDPENAEPQYLTRDDMEQALRITRPTAMHDINLKPPTIHWQDVGGQENLKKVLTRMIKNTKNTNPASRHVLRHPPKGLLLYGPPGCSKTLSAQAMATESSFNFFAVKGAELLNMYVGESERAVRTLFERARAASPSIIFFDEIDSIGGQRSGTGGLRSLLRVEEQRLRQHAHHPPHRDGRLRVPHRRPRPRRHQPAVRHRPRAHAPGALRPGPLRRTPDQAAREAVFNVHLKGLALASDVDVQTLATKADGYSGAEIKAICNEAGLAVLDRYDEDETGTEKLEIQMADLVAALERTPRNITREMIETYEEWSRQFKKT